MPRLNGSFSYKFDANPNPLYQFYLNMTRVFKLRCIAPGVGLITFHVVHPHVAGENQPDVMDRIDPAELEAPNAANTFQLFIMQRQPGQDLQLVQAEPEDDGVAYHIMWTEDYTMRVEGIHDYLMLYQQHQSAKTISY